MQNAINIIFSLVNELLVKFTLNHFWLIIINSQLNKLTNHFNNCGNVSKKGLIKETVSVIDNIYGSFGKYITKDATQQFGVKDCRLFGFTRKKCELILFHALKPETPFPATKKMQRKPLANANIVK